MEMIHYKLGLATVLLTGMACSAQITEDLQNEANAQQQTEVHEIGLVVSYDDNTYCSECVQVEWPQGQDLLARDLITHSKLEFTTASFGFGNAVCGIQRCSENFGCPADPNTCFCGTATGLDTEAFEEQACMPSKKNFANEEKPDAPMDTSSSSRCEDYASLDEALVAAQTNYSVSQPDGTNGDFSYWALFTANASAADGWDYAPMGISQLVLKDGDMVGFRWASSETHKPHDLDFSELCDGTAGLKCSTNRCSVFLPNIQR